MTLHGSLSCYKVPGGLADRYVGLIPTLGLILYMAPTLGCLDVGFDMD